MRSSGSSTAGQCSDGSAVSHHVEVDAPASASAARAQPLADVAPLGVRVSSGISGAPGPPRRGRRPRCVCPGGSRRPRARAAHLRRPCSIPISKAVLGVARCACAGGSLETEAMDGSASPAEPEAARSPSRSSSRVGACEVAWRSRARRASSGDMPQPSSVTATRSLHRLSRTLHPDPRPRRRRQAFSTSSLTTEAGRSTTSPAAIWSIRASGRSLRTSASATLSLSCGPVWTRLSPQGDGVPQVLRWGANRPPEPVKPDALELANSVDNPPEFQNRFRAFVP